MKMLFLIALILKKLRTKLFVFWLRYVYVEPFSCWMLYTAYVYICMVIKEVLK